MDGRAAPRRAWRILASIVELLARDAARNWLRNLRTVTPAVGTMAAMLALAGSGALAGLASAEVLRGESRDASLLHIYLESGADPADVAVLTRWLDRDPRVASVRYVSSQEALARARRRPGLAELADAAGANPFPASLDVRVRSLAEVGTLAPDLVGRPAVDPAFPTSYDAEAYRSLQAFVEVAGGITVVVVGALAALSALVTANAIRTAILTRVDDIAIMRLVGASGWMVRGPFLLEGALTGAAAGVVAVASLLALFAGVQWASGRVLTSLLPGVGWTVVTACAGQLLLAGVALGAGGALFGSRGLRA
jgi:cell division transport system permease protein